MPYANLSPMTTLSQELEKIRDDHYSGSVEILQQYIDLLKHQYKKGDLRSSIDKNFIIKNLEQLKKNHPTYFLVQHFVNEAIQVIWESKKAWDKNLFNFLKEYELTWKDVNKLIAARTESSFQLIHKTILLHSNSSALKSLFKFNRPDAAKIRIIQTESRPQAEGRVQARYLADIGYNVTLITDASIALYADMIDMVLLGADAIYKEFFVNKTGSHLIALVSQEFGIPLYVLADSRKIWNKQDYSGLSQTISEDPKPGSEVWDNPPEGINPENYYFETIPNKWVDLFITESEAINGKEIRNLKIIG
jgi:translation initiation factor 2B subunit (eIF-2B alpha/beta/delta family)